MGRRASLNPDLTITAHFFYTKPQTACIVKFPKIKCRFKVDNLKKICYNDYRK